MAVAKQKLREVVFQMLYSRDLVPEQEEDLLAFFRKHLNLSRGSVKEAKEVVDKLIPQLKNLDEKIFSISEEYASERVSRVEKNILRLAAFELFYTSEIPPAVVLAESIRLCRKFGTKESAKFVNAIIDTVYKRHLVKCSSTPKEA